MAYQPVILDKYLHISQTDQWGNWYEGVDRRIDGRYGMSPKIIVVHIQEGSNNGSWQHFHSVRASSTVLIGKNGEIWRLVPEEDGPWTNGDVNNPTALGWEIINKWGADPNVYSLTIECEGFTGQSVPESQMQAIVWQVQQWQQRYEISDYYVIRHADINQVDRPYCPGQALFAEVKRRITTDAPAPTPVVYAVPNKLRDKDGNVIDGTRDEILSNGALFKAEPREVRAAMDGVQPHLYATRTSAFTRTALNEGDEFNVIGWVRGENVGGDDRWWITRHFSRIDVNGTVEKPSSDDTQFVSPDAPPGTRIYKGVLYFPVSSRGKPYRNLKVARNANLREEATTDSSVVGVVRPEQYVRATHWCLGEVVKQSAAWWVIDVAKDGTDSIEHGPRLWVQATYSQPDEALAHP